MSLINIFNPFTGKLQKVLNEVEITDAIEHNENNVMTNAFRISILGSYSVLNMADGIVDYYQDETGIDTAECENQVYEPTAKYYKPFEGGGGVDEYTKLVAHFDEVDGSTTFIDSSGNGHTILANGNAQSDDARSKFGSASLLINNNVDWAYVANHSDFLLGANDWTIDGWMYFNSLPGINNRNPLANIWHSTAGNRSYLCTIGGSGTYTMQFNYSTTGSDTKGGASSNITITTGVWYHFAWCRSGNTVYMFHNGILKGTVDVGSDSFFASSDVFKIGGYTSNVQNANIDELRVSKGIARWVTDFTPSTLPYSVSEGIENMTLVSENFTADSAPDQIRIVSLIQYIDSITLNTDLKLYVSRDDGTTWTQITLEEDGEFDTTRKIIVGTVDVSGQPSDTDIRYKYVTANNKDLRIHATSELWS